MLVIETQFFPPVAYFVALQQHAEVCLDIHQNFEKQSYRNRCQILGPNGIQNLVVPVKKANSKQSSHQVEIDYSSAWVVQHLRSLQAAYAKAPFYEFYIDYFESVLKNELPFLVDLNQEILTLCLKFLKLDVQTSPSSSYLKDYPSAFSDLRSVIHPKKSMETLPNFCPFVYHQNFGVNFAPNLSVLDLIFNCGPGSSQILKKSQPTI